MPGLVGKNGEKLEPDIARAAIENGMCPFCEAGPFIVTLTHIARIHGVKQRELREMIRATWKQPLTTGDYHERASATRKALSSVDNFKSDTPSAVERHGRKERQLSTAGKKIRSEALARARETVTPEQRREWMSRSQKAHWAGMTGDEREALIERMKDGKKAYVDSLTDEDKMARGRRRSMALVDAMIERGETIGVDGLENLVARFRTAIESGVAKRSVLSKLAAEDGVRWSCIQRRIGKAVGLGLIAESELPAWKGRKFRRSIEFQRELEQ